MFWFLAACQTPSTDLPNQQPTVVVETPVSGVVEVTTVPPTPNGLAPDFVMETQGGELFTLSDHAGDVIMVDIAGFT